MLTPAVEAGRAKGITPEYAVMVAREEGLSRLLVLYVTTGLAFMLLPGTFLGVWNLVKISSQDASLSASTFILGSEPYSYPRLRYCPIPTLCYAIGLDRSIRGAV